MNNELNKKLAEWTGFRRIFPDYLDTTQDPPIYYPAHWEFKDEEGDIRYLCDCAPDFTESLDACFKWLVPRANEDNYEVAVSTEGKRCYGELFGQGQGGWYQADAETPALALCLAVEKLIDSEEK